MKSWNDNQSDLCSSDQELIFGENEDDLEEMMDLRDLPTSHFACSVHQAVFEEQKQKKDHLTTCGEPTTGSQLRERMLEQ